MSDELTIADLQKIHPILWVVGDPLEAFAEVWTTFAAKARLNNKSAPKVWTGATGLTQYWGAADDQHQPPQYAPDSADQLITALLSEDYLIVMADAFQESSTLVAAMNKVAVDSRRVAFISQDEPVGGLRTAYTRIHHLPQKDVTQAIQRTCEDNERKFDASFVAPLVGLTDHLAMTSVQEAFVQHTAVDDIVSFLKRKRGQSIAAASGETLVYEEPKITFENVVGSDRAKDVLKKLGEAAQKGEEVRGAFLLGVQGAGKTMIAKALAGELGLPLYQFEISAAMNELVGRSEGNIRRAINVLKGSPSAVILFDEQEKALAGSSAGAGAGDSGTAQRMGREILEYSNEPVSATGWHFFLATCNDLTGMRPEFYRAGRYDVLFWFGLPRNEVLSEALKMYRKKYDLPASFGPGKGKSLVGMTPAEVSSVCMLGARLKYNWAKASELVPILSRAQPELIKAMEDWARPRAINADQGGYEGSESAEKANVFEKGKVRQ